MTRPNRILLHAHCALHALCALCAISGLTNVPLAGAQELDGFSGVYGGIEAGTIQYSTQITFDGVDDPAGRSGLGYGAVLGYNFGSKAALVGAELVVNSAPPSSPYTFDPVVVGFSELDLRRGLSAGIDARAGYVVLDRVLLFGTLGFSVNKQSVRLDGVPLDRLAGGRPPTTFAALQLGAGVEAAVYRRLRFRFSLRALGGHDLNKFDFGAILEEAGLARFDVEPRQLQVFAGLVVRFRGILGK